MLPSAACHEPSLLLGDIESFINIFCWPQIVPETEALSRTWPARGE